VAVAPQPDARFDEIDLCDRGETLEGGAGAAFIQAPNAIASSIKWYVLAAVHQHSGQFLILYRAQSIA
jgi:hypothetical protein